MAAHEDGTIIINTKINTEGIQQGTGDIKNIFSQIKTATKGIGVAIGGAFAVKKIVQFGKEAIALGSDLQEVDNVVRATFGTMSGQVDTLAQSMAKSAGLSETMAKQYMGTFGAMSKSFGFTEKEAFNLSASLTQLSGDVSSFYNISQDEAFTKLKSVFTGETESLKDLGVVMTQTALDQYAMANGFGKTTSAMTEQEKVALRYQFVMEKLTTASGDFIRSSDSWANQTKILALQLQNIKTSIGQGLINVLTPVVKVINIILSKLAVLANAFKQFTELLTGKKTTNDMQATADATENVASATEDVGDATKKTAKEQQKYLSGLDEVRTYSENNQDSGSTGSTSAGGGLIGEIGNAFTDLETTVDGSANTIVEKMKWAAEQIKLGFDGAFKADPTELVGNIEKISESIKNVWDSQEVTEARQAFEEQALQTLGAVAGSVSSLAVSFTTGLTGGIASAKKDLEEFDKIKISSIFENLTKILGITEGLASAAATVGKAFESDGFQKIVEVITKIADVAILNALDLLSGLLSDLWVLATKPFIVNADKIKTILENVFSLISAILSPVEELVDAVAGGSKKYEDSFIHKFFIGVAAVLSSGIGLLLDALNLSLETLVGLITGELKLSDAFLLIFGLLSGDVSGNARISVTAKINDYKDQLKNKVLEFTAKIKDFNDKIRSKIISFTAKLSSFTDAIKNKTITKFKAKLTSFLDKIKKNDKVITFKAKITSFANKVTRAAKDFFGLSTGGIYKNGKWQPIKGYASGGYPQSARLFYANENGIPELVGRIGNSTAVMNNSQIVASVADGVYRAVSAAIGQLGKYFASISSSLSYIPVALNGIKANVPQAYSPALASGGIIPPALRVEESNKELIKTIEGLISVLRSQNTNNRGSSSTYRFVAELNRRVMFDEMITEAQARRGQTGYNPFELR